ncbi:glycine rich domain-containing protein, partial [bacterium]|nr:glycine rich domain-containing protein [bacterium]
MNSTYASGNTLHGAVTINTQGIQEWTVPVTGTYTIEVWGAAGGGNNSRTIGGKGARMKGTFSLTVGDVLKILVGQKGPNTTDSYNAGGGGGSFVIKGTNTILVIAAGGGGSSYSSASNYFSQSTADASTSNTGQYGRNGQAQSNAGSPGSNSNGGSV